MAQIKFSELTASTAVATTDEFPILQGGVNKLAPISQALANIDSTYLTGFKDPAYLSKFARWTAHGNNSSISAQGKAALTVTGTLTNSASSNASVYDISAHVENLVTVAATTAVVGLHYPTLQWCNQTGLTFFAEFGFATGVATATTRAFAGMTDSTSAPTDVDPSTLLNRYGIGWDDDDTNIQFMHNDGADACTKVDLGASFPVPTVDRTSVYQLWMHTAPDTGIVTYKVVNLNTLAVATGTISTNLPANTVMIAPRIWNSVGGTSSVIGFAFYDMWIKSAR